MKNNYIKNKYIENKRPIIKEITKSNVKRIEEAYISCDINTDDLIKYEENVCTIKSIDVNGNTIDTQTIHYHPIKDPLSPSYLEKKSNKNYISVCNSMEYINEKYPNNISYSFSISFQNYLSLNPQNKDLLDMVLFEDDFIKQFKQYIKRQINKIRPSSVRKSKKPIFLELISIIEISRSHFADLYSENNIEEQRSFHPHIHGIICFTSTFRKMKSSLESFEVMIKNVVSMINETNKFKKYKYASSKFTKLNEKSWNSYITKLINFSESGFTDQEIVYYRNQILTNKDIKKISKLNCKGITYGKEINVSKKAEWSNKRKEKLKKCHHKEITKKRVGKEPITETIINNYDDTGEEHFNTITSSSITFLDSNNNIL